MIKIRLSRQGAKNNPFYRIVAVDERVKVGGKPKGVLGHWYPANKNLELDGELLKKWVDKGAVVNPSVKKLLESKK